MCSYIISTVSAGEDLRQQRQPQDDSAHNLKHTQNKVLLDVAIHVSHDLAKDKVARFYFTSSYRLKYRWDTPPLQKWSQNIQNMSAIILFWVTSLSS